MNITEFKAIARKHLKVDEYIKYLPAFPTIPIHKRENFFKLLTDYAIEKAVTITGGDLPPYISKN